MIVRDGIETETKESYEEEEEREREREGNRDILIAVV